MNVEDSYEGAVRRLRRLGHGSAAVAPAARLRERDDHGQRIRDLEELATLACDENEQLKNELATAQHEIARLRQLVVSLQESLAAAHQIDDEPLEVPRHGRSGVFYFFLVLLIGGGALAAFQYRPWEHWQSILSMVGLTKPVVAAPASDPAKTELSPTGAQLATAQPATAQPAAAQPATAQPVGAQPATAQPVGAQPATAATVTPTATPTAQPSTAAPPVAATAQPAPTTAQPAIATTAPTTAKPETTIPKVQPAAAAPTVAPKASEPEQVMPTVKSRHHASKHHAKQGRREEKKHNAAARPSKKLQNTDTSDPLGGLTL